MNKLIENNIGVPHITLAEQVLRHLITLITVLGVFAVVYFTL